VKKYETYKDSGIEWIGHIPTDWQVMRLRYRGKSIIGITYKPEQVVTDKEDGILVLRSSNVQNGKLDFNDNVYVNKEINENQLTKERDILVCARNGSAHLVGKSAYIPKEWENVTFGAFMSIVRTDLDKFLFYYFNSQVFKGQKGLFATSTINQLTSNMLNNLDIPIPPTKSEQTQIANYLDRKTTEIDQLIADKKALVELYKEEKTAIINQAVTKGINPDAKMKDSGIEWLGEIPEHWEVKRIKNICKVRQGLQIPIDKRLMTFEEGSFEYITIRSINNPKDAKQYILNPSENVICTKDDVLMARTGATGIPIIDVEGVFHNNFFLIDYDRNKVERMYLFYFLKSSLIYEYLLLVAGTTTIPDLNHGAFYSTPFFTIDKEEQTQIVKFIDTELQKVHKKIAKAENYISLLNEYRTALINEVVTGKIKVTEE